MTQEERQQLREEYMKDMQALKKRFNTLRMNVQHRLEQEKLAKLRGAITKSDV